MRLGKKSKLALAFGLFVGFALIDINLHDFVGFYLTGVILVGLGIWLRKWRDGLEFYRRLRRGLSIIAMFCMFVGFLWFAHVLDNVWFGFMLAVFFTLSGLLVYVKRKHGIVEFQDLSEQQKAHVDQVMRNYSFYPYKLLVDWMLRKPKYASVRNALTLEEAKRSIGRGRADFVLEAVFPLVILFVIILFAVRII